MKYLLGLMLLPLLLSPAFAESPEDYEQVLPSEQGTLDIGLSVVPEAEANSISKLHIGWIKPGFNKIQEHIDYRITVIKDGENIFGPIPLTHTSIGTVKIPVEFLENGEHQIKVEMEGILFQPIPLETTYFTINVGEKQSTQPIQYGKSFMTGFNQIYYSFSPTVADYERESPVFKEIVKVSLTPMLTSFTILAHVPIDTEHEMLGYGIGVILLNVGMYFVAPAVLFTAIKKKLRK